MRRLFSFKTLILVLLAAGIGAMVALIVNQKQKFAGMSEEEIRAYLDQKLSGKMSEEQVGQIQDAVVSAVKGVSQAADKAEEAVLDAADAVAEAKEEAAEAVEEAMEEVAEVAEEVAEEAADEE
jgi:biopolymer transport protein ExbB/TolQ